MPPLGGAGAAIGRRGADLDFKIERTVSKGNHWLSC